MATAIKMLEPEDLTEEEVALQELVFREYDAILDCLPREPDMKAIREWLEVAYSLYDLPVPERIEIVSSPFAAFKLEAELAGSSSNYMDWCGVADAGWVSFYDYFKRIGARTGVLYEEPRLEGLNKEEQAREIADCLACRQMLLLRDFMRVAWDTVLLDECAIVIAMPVKVCRDDDGNLHSASGPCIEWRDGEKDYSWHGVWVPERTILDPRGYTRAEYDAISNTEERRALGEAAGWDHIVQLLGAKKIDSWKDARTLLEYELWAAKASRQQWIRKQSPTLQTAAQPFYFEPVHEDLKTAQGARKWQATARLGWTSSQCEKDPELAYGVET